MIVELHEDAAMDLEAAIGWYESQGRGLGHELEAEVDAAMDRIAELPLAWPPWRSDPRFDSFASFVSRITCRISSTVTEPS